MPNSNTLKVLGHVIANPKKFTRECRLAQQDLDQIKERLTEERELYLDLLVKVLTNVIYDDPSIMPGSPGFDPERRAIGYDWPSLAHTMVGVARLTNLKQLTQRTIDERVPGDYIETGVWREGCCIMMRAVLEANQIRNRKVFVADS
jgi:O-methyltransferase